MNVIKDILEDLASSKVSSNHCFYITFNTKNSKVEIPKHLLAEYPNEMTIVLQNQYWNLVVKQKFFLFLYPLIKKKKI